MSPVTHRKRQPRWSLNYGDITRARKRLGIDHHISFHLFKPSEWWYGWVSSPIHTIWLNPTIPKYDASYVVWHELTHILQCERDFNGDYDTFNAAFDSDYEKLTTELTANWVELSDRSSTAFQDWYERYHKIPLELEADNVADRYCERYPLIRA